MKKLALAIVLFAAFLVGYGQQGSAWPGVPDRTQYRGYFTNTLDTQGTYVLPRNYNNGFGPESFPGHINNADAFIAYLRGPGGLAGNARQRTGASFIIQTMIGLSRNRPPNAAELADWENRVRSAQAQGLITWRANFSYTVNSYYQGPESGGGTNDDAFYYESGTQYAMIFRNPGGGIAYAIKWECANPVGNIQPLQQDFNMSGRTVITANPTPRPGESVSFAHYVRNSGPGAGTNIWWVAVNPSNGAVTGGAANSGTYTAGQEKNVHNETYVVPVGTPAGTQICRQVGFDPVNGRGGRHGTGSPVCATVRYDYGLTPSVTVQVNGGATPGSTAEPGDSITFQYMVTNSGTTQSRPTDCTINGATYSGYQGSPGGLGPVPVADTCNVFPYNSTTTVATETFTAAENTTVCRSLSVNPSTHVLPGVTATSPVVCAYVANKPYVKAFGGDVAAGGGLTNAGGACTNNTNATIIGWNKRNAGADAWAGAGTQYAAMALRALNDFATTQVAGGAPAPSGLAFANTGITPANQNSGRFGNALGSLPCIPDYYASMPGSATTLSSASPINISSLGTGAYRASGNVTLSGGNINANQRTVLFVDGDAYINGTGITYTGSWDTASMPLFELVVRGNLFIAPSVTQLDGIYIAQQRTDGTRGYVYTCANTATPFTPLALDGSLFNRCNSRLRVNGPMVANRIYLLRTAGTLRQSTAGENRAGSSAGEIFTYNPANWIAQPTGIVNAAPDEYDSITSLPPVL